jgi:F-type H+-transporting ATPase subunit epsilon
MSGLHVEVVAADRAVWSGSARLVIARTAVGDIGILPGHESVLATLADSVVTVRSADGDQVFAVHGGFLSVADDAVSVLAETAERSEEIDVDRARRALERAQHGDADEGGTRESLAQAEHRAETRLHAAEAHLRH